MHHAGLVQDLSRKPEAKAAHAGNLRKGRYSELGRPYAITFVTYQRQPFLRELGRCRIVARALCMQPDTETLAFVIMPHHVHWLTRLTATVRLSMAVKQVKGGSARRINRSLERTGQVWQPGYHDHALRREEDMRAIARYIIANPVRAGIVERIGDYPHWDAAWL